MKIIDVQFTELSKADYDALTPELQSECTMLLKKLKRVGKKLGIPLENKNGKDLSGYFKLYFNEAQHRIVYTANDERIEIINLGEVMKETVEIVGIGARDKELIYNLVFQRINLQE
jgi:Txe/YoeB family toxin of Txe-Axe toxin-antitoxin module